MTLKDVVGLLFIGAGASVGPLGYRILGLPWYYGAFPLLFIGIALIWSAERNRKIRAASEEINGDWGDRHYGSGFHATDDSGSGGGHGDD